MSRSLSLLALAPMIVAVPSQERPDLAATARGCLSPDPSVADASVAALRAVGPLGVEEFREAHAASLSACEKDASGAACRRLLDALDRIAGQRGALASRLFWYTDLEAAKAAARESDRPILSLHLLGRLDQDFSCANSRFFRTVLYADPKVATALRDRFVLHWHSVRPAPRVTVDFGDGRRLERTLTGNSTHYVLAKDGRPVDALPGLYGPRAFLAGLTDAEALARAYVGAPDARRDDVLRTLHAKAQARLEATRARELAALGLQLEPDAVSAAGRAARADRLAVTKAAVQAPLVGGMTAGEPRPAPNDASWRAIGLRHLADARLSDSARALVAREARDAAAAAQRLEERIAEDTARNELDLHARLHGWFAEGSAPRDLPGLNARVYAELFLAAAPDDPWAGLAPDDLYVGLPNGGRVGDRIE